MTNLRLIFFFSLCAFCAFLWLILLRYYLREKTKHGAATKRHRSHGRKRSDEYGMTNFANWSSSSSYVPFVPFCG
jgi:hypothetical protein